MHLALGFVIAIVFVFLDRFSTVFAVKGDMHPLLAAWRVFTARLRRAGIDKRTEEPPLSFGQRAAELLPKQAEWLLSVSSRYAGWRYAGLELTDEEQRELAQDLRAFRVQTR